MRRREAKVRWISLASAVVLVTGLLAALPLASPPAQAVPGNLVVNPSLEDGQGLPTCFSRSGWGTEGTWTFQPGRDGGRAVQVALQGRQAGDRKLLQAETAECAPRVQAGTTYDMEVWYTSTAPVTLTMFRHTAAGWSYWGDVERVPAANGWTAARATTPVIPEGTDQIIFGLSLDTDGTLATDDYSLVPVVAPGPPPAAELVPNGNLAQGAPVPACYQVAGWGARTVRQGLSTDVPAGSPQGTRSFQVTVSDYASGDVKLLTSEAAGCPPAVTAGEEYDLSVDYRSTGTAQHGLSLFTHTAAGWQYWTDVKAVPAADAWTAAPARTPVIPDGVDRLAFGLSAAGNGTLSTTNASAPQVVPEVLPPLGAPESVGSWTVQDEELPIRALHNTLLNDGRILLIAGSGNAEDLFDAGELRAVVWTPDTNEFKDIPVPYDMFCAGHVTLPDGKVLIAGGTASYPEGDQGPNTFKGSEKSYYFDPEDDTFHPTTDMAGAHWYPSLTKLGNGNIWSAGGLDEKAEGTVLTEMFDWKTMSWLPPNQVPQTWSYWGTYPHMFLLDDGTMFYTGAHTFGNGLPGTGASLYDWRTASIWDVPGLRQKDMRDQAGSVFIGPAQDQKLMIVGGGNTDGNAPAINLVDIIDLNEPAPAYVPGPDLPGPGKAYVNLVNLPDRTVLAANGARLNRTDNVNTAALYDPEANTWHSIDADPVSRNYHSTSILLPDGRVAIMGSNPADNSFELRVSVYSPPYLFKGVRPTVTSPEAASYGDTITLDVTGEPTTASLISPMSATHQTDTNARLVDVPLAGTGATRVAQIPDNPNLLPPGPYMLSVLDADGVPSIADWIWIS
ncbi:hypothetical protein AC792_10350 [Arthrobacter sp. RIT-PI-e]|uniref:galactose oxidase early set domain-containing protein n=1 Tax=Arthrobacter sp. RIT-PI-e TaxID=1681197 RepID=UPI0006763F2A|nr:galactose oxidase early set domain-containing protein [Arthrobacter sp. RIT-PI-e]KNC18758.1 hypothetical protein AC792_10350 [Arthrobacter sp. RIT-PI-e]